MEIRALLNEISVATKAKDAAALLAHHAPEVLAFDVVDPLVSRQGGSEAANGSVVRFVARTNPLRHERPQAFGQCRLGFLP